MSGRKKKALFAVLAVAGTLLLVEFACFVAVRALADQPDPNSAQTHLFDAHRNHRLNPGFRFANDESSKIHSDDGFRSDQPVSLAKPPRTLRIIALGTSALYGIGAGAPYPEHRPLLNDETITHFLEKQIRDQLATDGIDYRVEVINAAVSAYRTFHHLIYLGGTLLDYNPDIVINIDGHNDFYLAGPSDRQNTYAYSTSILVDEFNGRTFFLPYVTFVRALALYSNFFNLLERLNKRVWYATRVEKKLPHTPGRTFPPPADAESGIREAARRNYLSDLWQIHNLGQYAGFDHYVYLQPEIVFERDELLSESDQRIKQITLDHLQGNQAELMQRIRKMLPELFAEHEIPFFDVCELAPQNDAKEDLYLDYCHLTPEGARVTASRIFEHLYPKVVAKIESMQASGQQAAAPVP